MKQTTELTELQAANQWWFSIEKELCSELIHEYTELGVIGSKITDENLLHIYRREVIEPWRESVNINGLLNLKFSEPVVVTNHELIFQLYRREVLEKQPFKLPTPPFVVTLDGSGTNEDVVKLLERAGYDNRYDFIGIDALGINNVYGINNESKILDWATPSVYLPPTSITLTQLREAVEQNGLSSETSRKIEELGQSIGAFEKLPNDLAKWAEDDKATHPKYGNLKVRKVSGIGVHFVNKSGDFVVGHLHSKHHSQTPLSEFSRISPNDLATIAGDEQPEHNIPKCTCSDMLEAAKCQNHCRGRYMKPEPSLPQSEVNVTGAVYPMFDSAMSMVDWMMKNEGAILKDHYGRAWRYELYKFFFRDINAEWVEGVHCLHLFGTDIYYVAQKPNH